MSSTMLPANGGVSFLIYFRLPFDIYDSLVLYFDSRNANFFINYDNMF